MAREKETAGRDEKQNVTEGSKNENIFFHTEQKKREGKEKKMFFLSLQLEEYNRKAREHAEKQLKSKMTPEQVRMFKMC